MKKIKNLKAVHLKRLDGKPNEAFIIKALKFAKYFVEINKIIK